MNGLKTRTVMMETRSGLEFRFYSPYDHLVSVLLKRKYQLAIIWLTEADDASNVKLIGNNLADFLSSLLLEEEEQGYFHDQKNAWLKTDARLIVWLKIVNFLIFQQVLIKPFSQLVLGLKLFRRG
jgi:hypothetical protein